MGTLANRDTHEAQAFSRHHRHRSRHRSGGDPVNFKLLTMSQQAKKAPITRSSSGITSATALPNAAEGTVRSGRLFLLEMSGDRIHSMNPDGSPTRLSSPVAIARRHRRGCCGLRLVGLLPLRFLPSRSARGGAQSQRRLDRARRCAYNPYFMFKCRTCHHGPAPFRRTAANVRGEASRQYSRDRQGSLRSSFASLGPGVPLR